ncbi:P-loop containing nucleoside triphosphate hydrolase protein [Violaceomyces palustris]|uniref:P-loop containing nucleoside triphosphate hydrolase protein n=1 Tax=Violaceomyces palustris TaxID=1673888 RepID=A0ACD0P730_9BASI|nr:P-loop containing nucleoside triphosphate hydrolase protein [Violaceomyces palustris]
MTGSTTLFDRPLPIVERFSRHISNQYEKRRQVKDERTTSSAPLFVAMQGPQGCGKTTITNQLVAELEGKYGIRSCVLSMDDLYHTYANLTRVSEENPGNGLLVGRGQAGTHDLRLAEGVLKSIQSINHRAVGGGSEALAVKLPSFDKSLNSGQGDRAPTEDWKSVSPPLDLFILEGWSMGFHPLSPTRLRDVYKESEEGGTECMFLRHSLDHLQVVNRFLHEYAQILYPPFEVFLQVRPQEMKHVYKWRLDQERAMKANNGGKGMTDEEVRRFVDRYMPGYELYLSTVRTGGPGEGGKGQSPPWVGGGLTILVDEERNPVEEEYW